jgi:hypothetical protein
MNSFRHTPRRTRPGHRGSSDRRARWLTPAPPVNDDTAAITLWQTSARLLGWDYSVIAIPLEPPVGRLRRCQKWTPGTSLTEVSAQLSRANRRFGTSAGLGLLDDRDPAGAAGRTAPALPEVDSRNQFN